MTASRTITLATAIALLVGTPVSPTSGPSRPVHQTDPLAARTKGQPRAPVTVFEMADFQCPACRQFFLTTFPVIEQDYIRTGKVRWVFVNYPLTRLHPNASAAAELGLCAARQGRFWPMHDLLYRHQPDWGPLTDPGPYFRALGADSAGLRADTLAACLTSRATAAAVEEDSAAAGRAGANATPSFYIEGGLLTGAWPPADFRRVLDSIYLTKTAGSR
jgi:protein-disulfide isomerase